MGTTSTERYVPGQEGRCWFCGYEFRPNSTDTKDVPILFGVAKYRCEDCEERIHGTHQH